MTLLVAWLRGVLVTRGLRLASVMVGTAAAAALLAALIGFSMAASRNATATVIARLAIDWIVETPAGDASRARAAIRAATAVDALETIRVARASALSVRNATGVQTTGKAVVAALPERFAAAFPGTLRVIAGDTRSVLLAQQTATNLHARPGDLLTLRFAARAPQTLRVGGIVDLGDGAFVRPLDVSGAASDDIVLVADPHGTIVPLDSAQRAIVRLTRNFAADPGSAAIDVRRRERNVSARTSGRARIGDDLATALEAARADALYGRLLFLFLGAPGIALALVLVVVTGRTDEDRRRRERVLLELRGAGPRIAASFAALEGFAVAVVAAIVALAFATVLGLLAPAIVIAIAATCAIGALAWVLPALAPPRVRALRSAPRSVAPRWERSAIDVVLLVVGTAAYYQGAASGYNIVVAPEGTTATAVSYQAFLAPACIWIGGTLFVARVTRFALARATGALAGAMRPLAGSLAPIFAAALVRDRARIAAGTAPVALAVAFAVSTATFAATYAAQGRLDAELTNGADVTVIARAPLSLARALADVRAVRHVAAAEPMLHRGAYVGSDLQDLYAIDAARIAESAPLQDAYFDAGVGPALAALSARDDALLVSDETVRDYALRPGDPIRLRLRDAHGSESLLQFHFAGIVREFPTAPKDAFLVANASYVARATADGRVDTLLIRVDGDPSSVAAALRQLPALHGAIVTGIDTVVARVGSSLVALDVSGLARIELGAAILLVVAAVGLIWVLEANERRSEAAALVAIGAPRRVLTAALAGEGFVRVGFGTAAGVVLGLIVANILVKLLTGVFDPPPAHPTYPFGYLFGTVVAASAAAILAIVLAIENARRR
ncbi:MAG: hypothetical protein NVSMB19_24360 [Vulcanimicrobiaceae bacterium]